MSRWRWDVEPQFGRGGVRQGRPGEEIVRLAAQAEADLVLLGTNGQGAMSDFLLGGVSQYVVHRARVPVFVVRPPGPWT